MTLRTRRLILFFFLLAFIAVAPVVLLITAGFRYDWARGQVEKTGIIKLDSRPTGATVELNGRTQTETTPSSIFRLLPGDYEVKMELPNYLPWTKILRVDSGVTAISGPVNLFRDTRPVFRASADITTATFSDDGESAAYLRSATGFTELAVRDLRSGNEDVLARFTTDGCQDCILRWSPTGSRLLFSTTASGQREWSIYPRSATAAAKSVAIKLPLPATAARWSSDGTKVVAVTAGGVFAVDAADGVVRPLLLETGVQDIAAKGREVLILRERFPGVLMEKASLDGAGSAEPISLLAPGRYAFESTDGRTLLVSEKLETRLLLVDFADGRILANYPAGHAAWQQADGSGLLALWNDFELIYADPASGAQSLVTRLGSRINGCIWHPAGADLIFATDTGVTAIELDDRERHNTYELTKLSDIGEFRLVRNGALLRFFGTIGNQSGLFEREMQ